MTKSHKIYLEYLYDDFEYMFAKKGFDIVEFDTSFFCGKKTLICLYLHIREGLLSGQACM